MLNRAPLQAPNRHERRADLHAFKREAQVLRTFLIPPDDERLNAMPLLKAAARDWLDQLGVRVRHCLICNSWIVDRHHVGALLLSVPDIPKPTTVGTAAMCRECWDADLPAKALERACETVLHEVIPGGRFEPLEPRR
jgi:hypothetical protein